MTLFFILISNIFPVFAAPGFYQDSFERTITFYSKNRVAYDTSVAVAPYLHLIESETSQAAEKAAPTGSETKREHSVKGHFQLLYRPAIEMLHVPELYCAYDASSQESVLTKKNLLKIRLYGDLELIKPKDGKITVPEPVESVSMQGVRCWYQGREDSIKVKVRYTYSSPTLENATAIKFVGLWENEADRAKFYRNSTGELDPKYTGLRKFYTDWEKKGFVLDEPTVSYLSQTRGVAPIEAKVTVVTFAQARSFSLGKVAKGDWFQVKMAGEGLLRSGSKKYKLSFGETYPKLPSGKMDDPKEPALGVICKQNGVKVYESFAAKEEPFFGATQDGEITCSLNVPKAMTESKSQIKIMAVTQRIQKQPIVDSLKRYLDNEDDYAKKLVTRIMTLKESSQAIIQSLLEIQSKNLEKYRAEYAPNSRGPKRK